MLTLQEKCAQRKAKREARKRRNRSDTTRRYHKAKQEAREASRVAALRMLSVPTLTDILADATRETIAARARYENTAAEWIKDGRKLVNLEPIQKAKENLINARAKVKRIRAVIQEKIQ